YGFAIAGIPLPEPLPKEGKIGGYHCWTWVYDKQVGWFPIDASDARRWLDAGKGEVKDFLFGNLVLERSAVAFSRGRDIVLNPPQKGKPLNYFIYPYAEVDGQPVKAQWELSYQLQ
ncbi:MAG: transglutaminase-like domain-containing protein, partial [Armatimonadetes bacterium]|nr:transglutaminase-like domain-containing protein [Armatimonadota bacterium]